MDSFPPPNYVLTESTVPGIEVYKPAPPATDTTAQQAVVTFTCPQCGATTAYSVADGSLKCDHCGYTEKPKAVIVGKEAEESEFTVTTMQEAERGWGEDRQEMECQSCGARTVLPAQRITHTCAFCGSNKVIQRQAAQDGLRPRFLIPFSVDDQRCQGISRQWLGSSWMTPAILKTLVGLQAFSGVYLPFWTFDSTTRADWKAEVGHTRTERYYDIGSKTWRTRTHIDWRWESGHAQLRIENLVVPGTGRLSNLHLRKIRNFDLRGLVAYEPKYLAGFQAQAYDVKLDAAWEVGREEMREQTRQACRAQASTQMIRNFSMNVDFADEGWRYVLMPVYLAAYSYESKVFQVMINGQTGAISAQRPVDWSKVWLAIALLLAPGALVCLLGLVTLPLAGVGTLIGGVGLVLLIIGLVIAGIFFFQASHLGDA